MAAADAKGGSSIAGSESANILTLSEMLAAKWKSGGPAGGSGDSMQTGQVRQFRITAIDAENKRIDLEPAG
jgi:hypothetical protein